MKLGLLAIASALSMTLGARGLESMKATAPFTVHEWGTFTSIAGSRGEAIVWTPLAWKDDLPSFVEHYATSRTKRGLGGTVRMETPVLYFHASQPMTVSVHVAFKDGLLTEWYPHAAALDPPTSEGRGNLAGMIAGGQLFWNSVQIDPLQDMDFPTESAASRYYRARETAATPVTVNSATGYQKEKFLFYRGVASFPIPVTAIPVSPERIEISNSGAEPVPQAILFERRGTRAGYRILGPVQTKLETDSLELNSDVKLISQELQSILVGQGLNKDEALAMIRTWDDSWFEEGTRLLYIVPQEFVDAVLPLTIKPAPAATTRVFVGRMEIVTPATARAIETAFATGDQKTLEKYDRFLVPILQTMLANSQDAKRAKRLTRYLSMVNASQLKLLQAHS